MKAIVLKVLMVVAWVGIGIMILATLAGVVTTYLCLQYEIINPPPPYALRETPGPSFFYLLVMALGILGSPMVAIGGLISKPRNIAMWSIFTSIGYLFSYCGFIYFAITDIYEALTDWRDLLWIILAALPWILCLLTGIIMRKIDSGKMRSNKISPIIG